MSLIDKLFRSNPFNQPGAINDVGMVNAFLESFGQNRADSGEVVNTHTALQTSTVWACISLISKQIATNPLFMFRLDENGSKSLASDHDYFDLVFNRPNPVQNSVAFRTAVQISLLLHGNGYIELQRDNANRVVAMFHRSALRTEPLWLPDNTMAYRCKDTPDGHERFIKPEDMIHLMGATLDGFVGLSPIAFAKQSIGAKLAMDKYGARFFANNATPSGILSTKHKVKADDIPKMRAEWEAMQTGGNQHRISILDQELTYQAISIPQNDAQYLESKNASEKEIAAIFGVPGYAIGLLDKGIKANVEQQAQDLYNYCLRPIMATWEKEFTCKLFSSRGRSAGRLIVKFDTRELLRPDAPSRQTYYQSGIQNGWLSQDEVRDLEGYNAIPNGDGDGYYIQLNMQSLALANSTDPTKNPPDNELAQEMETNSLPKKLGQNYRGLFKDGMQRLMKNTNRDYKAVFRCMWPTIDALAQAARATQPTLKENGETLKAIDKLIEGMEHRAKKWDAESIESLLDDEMKRVAKALIFSTNADAANQKSKQDVAELEDEAEQEID